MASSYIQVSLDIDQNQAESVSDILESYGALSVTITSADSQESFDVAQPGNPRWPEQRLCGLFEGNKDVEALLNEIGLNFSLAEAPIIDRLEDQDWEKVWLDNFKPFEVGRNLWVCPSWCQPPDKSAVNLMIDPGLAFGTGSHETTHLCLAFLSRQSLTGKSVVDFGCGSGILGIAAAKLGADSVLGVDIDPKAVRSTNDNCQANQVSDKMRGYENEAFVDLFPDFRADIVIANILANTLIELNHYISNLINKNGLLMLSGVLDSQLSEVTKAYDFRFDFSVEQNNHWLLLIGRPRN